MARNARKDPSTYGDFVPHHPKKQVIVDLLTPIKIGNQVILGDDDSEATLSSSELKKMMEKESGNGNSLSSDAEVLVTPTNNKENHGARSAAEEDDDSLSDDGVVEHDIQFSQVQGFIEEQFNLSSPDKYWEKY